MNMWQGHWTLVSHFNEHVSLNSPPTRELVGPGSPVTGGSSSV